MNSQVRIAVIIPAAGSGSRFGASVPKQFLPLAGEPVLRRTVSRFQTAGVDRIIVAISPGAEAQVRSAVATNGIQLVHGGVTRQKSVRNGLRELMSERDEFDLIAVHDAVRPCFGRSMWSRLLARAMEAGAAVPVMPPLDTVHRIANGHIVDTPPRETLALAQTPQLFRPAILQEAFDRAAAEGVSGTDEAGIVAAAGHQVAVVEGDRWNLKITTPEDLARAESSFAEWSRW